MRAKHYHMSVFPNPHITHSHALAEIRELYKGNRKATPGPILLPDLQSPSDRHHRTIQSRRRVLFMLHPMPRRTHTRGTIQQERLRLRLWDDSSTSRFTMHPPPQPRNKYQRRSSFRGARCGQQLQPEFPESILRLRMRL